MNPIHLERYFVCAFSLILGIASTGLLGAENSRIHLEGDYRVVALRKTNLALAGPQDLSLGEVGPGSEVQFGSELRWLWRSPTGRHCKGWSVQRAGEPVVPLSDDMISDTQVMAGEQNDFRVNEHLIIRCGPKILARVLAVDNRVLVTTSPSGQSYLLLERVPSEEEVSAVQKALADTGLLEGPLTGRMTANARRALAIFAGQLGAAYNFNATAISNNLLLALGLPSLTEGLPAATWTDEQIAQEMQRYRFENTLRQDGNTWVVLSEFFETGETWPDLSTQYEKETSPAYQRLTMIQSYLQSLPSTRYSVLEDQLTLLKLDRAGDWTCYVALGCYPKGWVVGLGPLEPELAGEICELFRRNEWFCAIPDNLLDE
jgi:hypothetical protein